VRGPSALLLSTVAAVVGCRGTTGGGLAASPSYGDPVGVELPADGEVPALSLRLAVTKGRDPAPTAGSIAGAMVDAAAACPAFVRAMAGGATVPLALSERNGLFRGSRAGDDGAGADCVVEHLAGRTVTMDRPEPLDVLLEAKAAPSTPKPAR
jgi:hypothetical protein